MEVGEWGLETLLGFVSLGMHKIGLGAKTCKVLVTLPYLNFTMQDVYARIVLILTGAYMSADQYLLSSLMIDHSCPF